MTSPSKFKVPGSNDNDLPEWGWLVTATTPDGRVMEQQFLVALEDGDAAMTAARDKANPEFILALGSRVEGEHFIRRKMKLGGVFELGNQRIGRGKNTCR